MRDVMTGLTTRGRSFLAAGFAAAVCGLVLGERGLLQIGVLLIALPLLSALATSRTSYQLTCKRQLSPARVPVGQPTVVTLRLANVTRLRTGLLLAEDELPHPLGGHPRFILDAVDGGADHPDLPQRQPGPAVPPRIRPGPEPSDRELGSGTRTRSPAWDPTARYRALLGCRRHSPA